MTLGFDEQNVGTRTEGTSTTDVGSSQTANVDAAWWVSLGTCWLEHATYADGKRQEDLIYNQMKTTR